MKNATINEYVDFTLVDGEVEYTTRGCGCCADGGSITIAEAIESVKDTIAELQKFLTVLETANTTEARS